MSNITTLPPFCPHCHRSFFYAGPLGSEHKYQCHCEKGKKMVLDWLDEQKLVIGLTNPRDIIKEDIKENINEGISKELNDGN